MRSGGPIAALMAGALLVAGCDYWRNLVGDKVVSHAKVNITVKDAWTGQVLPFAVCHDAEAKMDRHADADGKIRLSEAQTGHYQLTCVFDGYYDFVLEFDQGLAESDRVAGLARLGGTDWYPDEPDKQVDIRSDGDNTRVPADLTFRAAPTDTTGALRYIWTFARHPELSRDLASGSSAKSVFRAKLAAIPADSAGDTLTLRVVVRLPGRSDYEVGSMRRPIVWVRNRIPEFGLLQSPLPEIKIGCPDDQPYRISYKATDPDGRCEGVRFTTADSSNALGKVDINQSCTGKPISIPMVNPFRKFEGEGLEGILADTSQLKMSVWDDNHQFHDTTFTLITRPRTLPKVNLQKTDSRSFLYEKMAVQFMVTAQDTESSLHQLRIYWTPNDSSIYDFPAIPTVPSISMTPTHIYQNSGFYSPIAVLYNGCGSVDSSLAGSFLIYQNEQPRITVHEVKYARPNPGDSLQKLLLHFSVKDKDIGLGTDSLIISVDWDDGTPSESFQSRSLITPDTVLTHSYAKPFSEGFHDIYINVDDRFDGRVDTTLHVLPYQP